MYNSLTSKNRRQSAPAWNSDQSTMRMFAPGVNETHDTPPDEHVLSRDRHNRHGSIVTRLNDAAPDGRVSNNSYTSGLDGNQPASMIGRFDNRTRHPSRPVPNEYVIRTPMPMHVARSSFGGPPWSQENLRIDQQLRWNEQPRVYAHNQQPFHMEPSAHNPGPFVMQQPHHSHAYGDGSTYDPDPATRGEFDDTASPESTFSHYLSSGPANAAPVSDSPPSSHEANSEDMAPSYPTTRQSNADTSDPQTNTADAVTCRYKNCVAKFHGEYKKGNRVRHMKSSHGVLTECKYPNCKKTFNRSDARLKHYRKEHPSLATEPQRRKPVVDHSVVEHMTSWSDPITNEGRAQYLE